MPELIVNCDWGTTQFRLRAVELDRFDVAAEFRSADGVAGLAAECSGGERSSRYQLVLAAGLQNLTARLGNRLQGAPVLVSGMASSSIGWREVRYARLPISLDSPQLEWLELEAIASDLGPHRVLLISGACTETDVMRGEETEVIGLFALPTVAALAGAALVIKPGTHSKHLHVQDRSVVGLRTFMTGELFDVLGRHSILRHSLEAPSAAAIGSAAAVGELRAGVRHGSATELSTALFRVRTRQLFASAPVAENRAFFSGVLLGSELAYLTEARFSRIPLVLCATAPLDTHYRVALDELGLAGQMTAIAPSQVETLSARGQVEIWRNLIAAE